jgi:hypothetical protein
MPAHKWSDLEIAVRIVPTSLRWPQSGASTAWTTVHDCVDAYRDLVRSIDIACVEAEQNRQLSSSDIVRRRAALCDDALRRLANFRPLEAAETALTEEINALERLRDRDAQQVQMHVTSRRAVRDLREGVAATRRAVQERCKVRQVVSA